MAAVSWSLPLIAWSIAPLLLGIINRVKAAFAGRQGPPLLQPYRDLAKLMRKGVVISRSTSWIFALAPALVPAALMLATLLIPWGGVPAPLAFGGDFILLAYLLGGARFATVLAALDTGSSFEGMGASREVQFAALAEPVFFLGLLLLAVVTGRHGLSAIMAGIGPALWGATPAVLLLLACAWMVLLLAENARIPVDDPNTHLELTMIHEVMILDTSGPDLGLITYAAALKLWLYCALLANLAVPLRPAAPLLQMALILGGTIAVAAVVGVVESVTARLRLRHVPKLLIGAGALVATALILTLAG
jgi:formate hydrogenlyase subunit 4